MKSVYESIMAGLTEAVEMLQLKTSIRYENIKIAEWPVIDCHPAISL